MANTKDEYELNLKDIQRMVQSETPPKALRKSRRSRKTPIHLTDSVTDASAIGASIQKHILKSAAKAEDQRNSQLKACSKPKPQSRLNIYPDFKCDHCGSRYVVNPMRRGNKIGASKYKAAPRHKVDPESQKMLTLCNACGLKFGRQKKKKPGKVELSEEDQKKYQEEGETFAQDLSLKLDNELASRLYCSSVKKTVCGCIQKYIYGTEDACADDILTRAQELLDILMAATELKKLKCYDATALEERTGKKCGPKIGLGNGHRKSKEFEHFVLTKREYLRNDLRICEKGRQKILSYSNNFLHKRMKTDPEKGVRIERQKGKAALGTLRPIQDLPLEACCVDNCVQMALTHGRLLEVWRERANSSQVEARRVLAEMLTPSGGNRANCYRFVSWVTGCSNTTIGKVSDQMKSTGGDREPPEHGLKKYWKENPKNKAPKVYPTTFVPSYQILQAAANTAGLSTIMQEDIQEQPLHTHAKRTKRQSKPKVETKIEKVEIPTDNTRAGMNVMNATNLQNLSAAVIALNGNYPGGSFISIPAGLTAGNTITIPNGVPLQTIQQQIQQQQLQLQIQMLQQQLQNNHHPTAMTHGMQQSNENTEFMVTVSNPLEQNNMVQSVGTPVVVQTVTTQPVVQNVVTQSLVPNVVNNDALLPAIVDHSSGSINFVSSGGNVNLVHQQNNEPARNNQNISLLTSPLTNNGEISIIAQNNAVRVLTPQTHLTETSVFGCTRPQQMDNYRAVQFITSQSPTMALSQPVTISLQTTPTISLSNLPAMLLTQSTPDDNQQQLIIQQNSTPTHRSEQLILHSPLSVQSPSEQLVIQQSIPSVQSTTEPIAISSSVLPPMTSFNADAFLTGAMQS